MPYYRVTYQYYVEGEYKNEDVAKEIMLEIISEATGEDLSIEEFDEETKEWK
jgi:hypothetical protein